MRSFRPIRCSLRRRRVMNMRHRDDQHDRGDYVRWRSPRRQRTGACMHALRRPQRDPAPLNGFAAQFATAVGAVFIAFVFKLSRCGMTLEQAARTATIS